MPTQAKEDAVSELADKFGRSSIVITTDYSGLPVGEMTALRRALREAGVEYRVVKNTLAYLAADAAGRPAIKEAIEGPTGIALGYGEPTEPAKALSGFIRSARSDLKVRGGELDGKTLTYLKEPCAEEDARGRFLLSVHPARLSDVPEDRREKGGHESLNFDFDRWGVIFGGKCMARRALPDYKVDSVEAGQWIPGGERLWSVEFEVGN